jgi:hypothetical protein
MFQPRVRPSQASRLLTVSQSSMCLNAEREPSGGDSLDALSPLPVPVAFRQPREMRHRRVNSWGTPTDNNPNMQRSGSASSFNTVIDIDMLSNDRLS